MNAQLMSPIPNGVSGFQAAISDIYFPYIVERVSKETHFKSAAASVSLGNLQMSRTYVNSPFLGARPSGQRCPTSKNFYILMLVEEGELMFKGNSTAIARDGDIVLLNAASPFESEQRRIGTTLSVKIPATLLKLRYAQVDEWCLRTIPSTEGASALLRNYLTSYWDIFGSLRCPENTNLETALVNLIGAALTDEKDLPIFESHSIKMHFQRIRSIVSRHLDKTELDGDFVAKQLGISKSYMFMVMNAAGTTLRRFILEQRLERIRSILSDPASTDRTITEIAFSVGFQDLSHFSKRFTEQYGKSPRAYRVTALRAADKEED